MKYILTFMSVITIGVMFWGCVYLCLLIPPVVTCTFLGILLYHVLLGCFLKYIFERRRYEAGPIFVERKTTPNKFDWKGFTVE